MPELQMPDIAGNFLSSYYTAQQKTQADADRQRNMQRQDVADERASQQFDMQMDLGKIQTAKARTDALNEILSGVDPANEQSLIMAKQRFIQDFEARPEDVAHITMADIPRIKMQTGQTAAELDLQYKRAQIAATNRSNRGGGAGGDGGSKPPAGYQWVRAQDGSLSLAPIKGGPAEAQRQKMNDEQAKALGFAKRIGDANAVLEDPGYQQALLSGKENVAASIPLVGNALVSEGYQMADQAVRDFINAQLRRESGAVIAESEFANARAQYIPVYGDKPEVLARKRLARQRALENLYVSSGPSNYGTAETVAQGLPGTPQPGAAASATSIPRVSTKAQFDALPSGSVYMEDDGKRYTKP
jgi:hypothetical protein